MAAAHASAELEERHRFERWVANLDADCRSRLATHIEAARLGPAWLRARLAATDLSSATHVPPVDAFRDIQDALEEFERGDYVDLSPEQLERWVETGEQPWPDESPA